MATAKLLRLCVLVLASHYFVSLMAAPLGTRYSNSFAVGVQGGRDKADKIAAKYGFTNMGPVSIYLLFQSVHVTFFDRLVVYMTTISLSVRNSQVKVLL